jgi:hypothetical protein
LILKNSLLKAINLDKNIRLIINVMSFLLFSRKEDLMGRLKKDE